MVPKTNIMKDVLHKKVFTDYYCMNISFLCLWITGVYSYMQGRKNSLCGCEDLGQSTFFSFWVSSLSAVLHCVLSDIMCIQSSVYS